MAGWYERNIVPHIIRLGCGCAFIGDFRRQVVPHARGRVLEIGMGAGANLAFYDPSKITHLSAIEPSAELRAMANKALKSAAFDVDLLDASGEAMPFEQQSFDTVVCTFTLCSVDDVTRTLGEARRVLKPGGQFLFCEHGQSPDPDVRKWQQRFDPLWKRLFGGCHISRPVRGNIERHFAINQWEGGYQGRMPRIAGWMEWGQAIAA
jgi:SAM-dependent methyltransferase